MTDKETFQINWPGRIMFGAGKLAALGEEAKALGGERVLVVTTKDLVNLGVVDRAESILRDAGLTATRFDDVQPDPTCEAVDRAEDGHQGVGPCRQLLSVHEHDGSRRDARRAGPGAGAGNPARL